MIVILHTDTVQMHFYLILIYMLETNELHLKGGLTYGSMGILHTDHCKCIFILYSCTCYNPGQNGWENSYMYVFYTHLVQIFFKITNPPSPSHQKQCCTFTGQQGHTSHWPLQMHLYLIPIYMLQTNELYSKGSLTYGNMAILHTELCKCIFISYSCTLS